MARFLAALGLVAASAAGSPVQKVIQLMGECKAKIESDVKSEQAAMEEYMNYCHDEVVERSYAIKASERDIADLEATIAETEATVASCSEQITALGEEIAAKGRELAGAKAERDSQYADFQAADKELMAAVDETAAAVAELEKGMALAQGAQAKPVPLEQVKDVLERVVDSTAIVIGSSRERLQSLLQAESGAGEELTTNFKAALRQQPPAAFESQSGGILEMVKGMQDKAENQLSDLRKKEMENKQAFQMLEDSLNTEIAQKNTKLSSNQALKASSSEKLAQAQGDMEATQKTKADDEQYSATMKQDCATKASQFEERTISAKGELAAIAKATEILENGVVALVQTRVGDDDNRRLRAATELRNLGRKFHRIGFMELATAVGTDPFVKIRGLVEDMIAKLQREAAEEATHKAFCDTEMGKSNAAKEMKTQKAEKHQTRMDEASSEIAALTADVTRLEKEIGEIDKAQAEATELRTAENAENTKTMKDLQQSADAVIAAIGTLQAFYQGASLVQLNHRSTASRAGQPDFAAAKSDSASGIISVLEVAQSDFTKLFAETEAAETAAAASYEKSSKENKIARAQKVVDVKGKGSQIKSLEVTLSRNSEDHEAVASELSAVEAYLAKLAPECETKVMSYGEKKAAREAEIEGLKDALEILTA